MILEAKERTNGPYKARREGDIPAVFYGPKEKSTPISVSASVFKKIWSKSGESSIITLKVADKELESLIHDVDKDPVTGEVLHIDFYIIEKGKKVQVNVPLLYAGVSPAVKDLGGILVKVLHEVEIEALPKDLPQNIEVDISVLTDFDEQITLKDLKMPAGVSIVGNIDEVVAMAHEAKEEAIEVAPAPDLSTIEVEKKGKEANADEGGEAETTEAK